MERKRKIIYLISLIILINISFTLAETSYISTSDYTIEYSYDKSTAEPDSRITLTVKITNEDNQNKTNVILQIDDGFPFEISGDDKFEINNLEPSQTKSKTFNILIDEKAEDKKYKLDFTFEDDNDDFDDYFEISVNSNQPNLFIGTIESSPLTIMPDTDEVKLTLTLENSGETDARFIEAKLILPNGLTPSTSYSNRATIGSINSGENKQIDFYFDVSENIKPTNQIAKLVLNYETEDKDKIYKEIPFEIPIKGKPLFRITSTILTPSIPEQGEKATLKITITNIGETEGKETSIRIFENSDLPIELEEKTRHIGNLKKGESGTAVFSFKIDKNAYPSTYLLKVQTRTINKNQVFVQEESTQITIKEKQTALNFQFSPLWIIVIVVALIMFLLSYLVFKKR